MNLEKEKVAFCGWTFWGKNAFADWSLKEASMITFFSKISHGFESAFLKLKGEEANYTREEGKHEKVHEYGEGVWGE